MPEREGQRFGNYRLHRLLGKGSFAEVYLGEHLYLRTSAAIKILHTSLNEQEEQLFLSEARMIAQLSHPNIVQVREFAIERSIPFLVMDYAPGGTLRHRYPRGTCLSLEQTVTYVKQIAAALQYAHNRGIIHRDVKPENVLQGVGQAMLSDFGISVQAPQPDTSQQWAGTLSYMAPEQYQSKAAFASDQYALAIMAYEWLCGVRPFEGSSVGLAYQHSHVSPPPLREKDPSLPEAVETVILKALSKAPEERYVSIINFARALEYASSGDDASHELQPETKTDPPDSPQRIHTRRVFLSHALQDTISRLRSDLTMRDIAVQGESAPEPQEEQIRQDMRAAQIVLLVLTSHTRADATVQEHLRIAALYCRSTLCIWTEGRDLRDLLPAGVEQAPILDARGERYAQALDEIVTALEREQHGPAVEVSLPMLDFEPRNPYKGLRAFTQNDRADFFGRESVVQQLLARMKNMVRPAAVAVGEYQARVDAESRAVADSASEPRFLAVVGPSGSGKSSMLMAGLLPKLRDGAFPGSEEWVYLGPMVPGKQPLETLTQLLATHFPAKGLEATSEVLKREGGFGLHQLGLTLVSQPEMRVVVTIDQFEELFSSDIPEQERLHLIRVLVTAATEPRGPVIVLLTLRADFYDRPFAYPELGRLVQQQQYALSPMSAADLREVIERPASLPDVLLTFDAELVGDLLFDLRGQAAALPLLEFTLDQLFAHRRDHRLTRSAYQEIGGVRGALSRHAESTYAALPSEEHRRLARTLFLRLVQLGGEGQDPLRRRADPSEFVLESADQTRVLQEVTYAFLAARLIASIRLATTSALEISHEALLREWPRLATWIREAREDIRFQQTMSNDVREWERRGKPRDRLYRGSQLKESLAWQSRNLASGNEATFLRASTARRKRGYLGLALAVLLLLAILVPAGIFLQQQVALSLVTTLKDDAPGSLRQVIANARPGSTIFINPALKGTITLSQTLVISKNLTIRGPGVNQLTIRGTRDQNGYLIHIPHNTIVTISQMTFSEPKPSIGPVIRNEGTLTLDTCHITGNTQTSVAGPGSGGGGAGILNAGGILTLQNSIISHNTITNNQGVSGVGISSSGGSVTIKDSQIVDNIGIADGSFAGGGGISSSGSNITIINSIIARNKMTGGPKTAVEGGGIFYAKGTLTLTNSSVTENTVVGGDQSTLVGGGGIFGYEASHITLTNSTISRNSLMGNSAKETVFGGGLFIQLSPTTISNSHISGNIIVSKNIALGGGIAFYQASTTINSGTISDNTATSNGSKGGAGGGGIENEGTLIIGNSNFSGNTIVSSGTYSIGGGIHSSQVSTTTVTNSTFSKNTARSNGNGPGEGGGIGNEGLFTVSNSTFQDNLSESNAFASGGGLVNIHPKGVFLVTGSTFLANKVSGKQLSQGGGIDNDSKITVLENTFSGNTASGDKGFGGGIAFYGTNGFSTLIRFSTLYGNTASEGGGIWIDPTGSGGTLTLGGSIVAGNHAERSLDLSGILTSDGYNLIGNTAGAKGLKTTDRQVALPDLKLDTTLRNNGGSTQTFALLPGSAASNVVPANICRITLTDPSGHSETITTDQRGHPRLAGAESTCDAGAYESN